VWWKVLRIASIVGLAIFGIATLGFATNMHEDGSVGGLILCLLVIGGLAFGLIKVQKKIKQPTAQATQTIAQPMNTPLAPRPQHFDDMDGHEFERFCAKVLLANGFQRADVTRGSGDFGVDILAEKDGITYAIQCKRYSSNIGNTAVQEIYSGRDFHKRHIGAVMTNQFFTRAAKETAERTGVVLWDRDWLTQQSRMLQPINPINFHHADRCTACDAALRVDGAKTLEFCTMCGEKQISIAK
jgi:restriction system protein